MTFERPRVTAYVGLGANLGDAKHAVTVAIQGIASLPQTELVSQSALYRSVPVGASGPDYINAVVEVSTGLNPQALLLALQQLEANAGRERPYPNAPRTLDLDLLLYGEACVSSDTLTVPHPRLSERAFVLLPLSEIAPDRVSSAQRQAVSDQVITRL